MKTHMKLLSAHNLSKTNKGFITLLSILVVAAVGVAIVLSLILLGLGSSRTSFALQQSDQARALAGACSEEALQQIRDFLPYSGIGNLSSSAGTCSYTVAKGTGQNRTITASGTVGTIVRKVEIVINTINPQIVITSWQEVNDF